MTGNPSRSSWPGTMRGIAVGVSVLLICGAVILFRFYPDLRPFFPSCPFYGLFHLYCPGCGSTRATYCLLHGDLSGVWRHNPFYFPTLIFVFSLVFLRKWAGKPILVRTYIVLLVLFWLCRNLPWHPFTLLAPPPGF